jgi:hypothetical protein
MAYRYGSHNELPPGQYTLGQPYFHSGGIAVILFCKFLCPSIYFDPQTPLKTRPLFHHLLQPINFLNPTPVYRKVALHRQRSIGLGKEPLDFSIGQLSDLIGAESHPLVTAHQVLNAEDVRHLLAHQLTALA